MKIDKIQLEIAINGDESRQNLMKLEQQAKQLKKELKHASDPADITRLKNAIAAVENEMEDLNQKIGITGMTMKELKNRANILRTALDHLVPGSKMHTDYDNELKAVGARMTELRGGAAKTGMSIGKMADGFNRFAMLGATVVAAFTGVVFSIKKFISGNADLDDSLANIRKTTGMTTQEVESLNKQLGKINTRTSREELRQIAVVAGQLGISKEQVFGFTKAVDKLNVALSDEFTGGAEEVAKQMGTLRNVFTDMQSGNVAQDMLFIGNAINALGAAGFATGPVMADFSNRIGGVGITLGLTSGEVLGMSATLQELNVNAERGGTAVSKIMMKMTQNTSDFAEVAGMDVKSFSNLVDTDLYGAFMKVVEGSQKGGSSATAMGKILNDLGVDGAGAAEVFTKLGKNTKLLQEKVDLANVSLKNTNSITNEFNIKNETLGAKLEKIGKAIRGAFVNSGAKEAIDGIVNGIYKWMGLDQVSILQREKSEINNLVGAITSLNSKSEIRKRLLTELQEKYPDFLGNLNAEKVTNEELAKRLEEVNDQYLKRIRIAVIQEDITKNEKEMFKVQKEQRRIVLQIAEDYEKLVKNKKENATIDEKLKAISESTIDVMVGQILTSQKQDLLAGYYKRKLNDLLEEENQLNTDYNDLLKERSTIKVDETIPGEGNKKVEKKSVTVSTPLTDEEKKRLDELAKLREEYRKKGLSDEQQENERFTELVKKLGLDKLQLTDQEYTLLETANQEHINNLAAINKKASDDDIKELEDRFKKYDAVLANKYENDRQQLELDHANGLLNDEQYKSKLEENTLNQLTAEKTLRENMGLDTVELEAKIANQTYKIRLTEAQRIALLTKKQKDDELNQLQERAQLMQQFISQTSSAIETAAANNENIFEAAASSMLMMGLELLKNQVELAMVGVTIQSLAQPDSVATLGSSGLLRAGIIIGLIEAAFAVVKGKLSAELGGGKKRVPQYAEGNYPIVSNPNHTGLYSQPTMFLAGEKEPEIVISGPHTRNLQMNYPAIVDAIWMTRNGGVPRYANGNYPASVSANSQAVPYTDPDMKNLLAANAKLLQYLAENGVHGDISWKPTDTRNLNDKQTALAAIKSKASMV